MRLRGTERKLIIEPIKEGDMGELCLGGNIFVDSCIWKLSALNVMFNISTILFHWEGLISPDWPHCPDIWGNM